MADMSKKIVKPPVAALAIAALGVDLADASAVADFRLIPAGSFRSRDGRPVECAAWVLTPEDGARIVREISATTSALVIDYEHGTLHAKKNGSKAPAAGWFKQLEMRDDGLWAVGVDWTAAAAQEIADKTYRYISPVFSYDPQSGRVLKLFHAALTNDPGLDGLTDLAALAADLFLPHPNHQETSMNELLKKLLAALGLQETATEAEALAAMDALKTNVTALTAQVAAPDPAKFVPIATLTALQGEKNELQTKFAALQAEVDTGKLDKVIGDAKAAGKLTPATEAWARDLGKKDLAALTSFIDAAPVVVKPGNTQTGGNGKGGTDVDDPLALAAAARQYQDEESAAGRSVSIEAAVAHVVASNQ